MSSNNECVFCQKVINQVTNEDSDVTIESPHRVASFEPLNPVTPGHRLFIPTYHVEHGGYEAGFALAEVIEVASNYAGEMGKDFNLITSSGPAATQTIDHIHVHYVPRYDGDTLHLPWTITT